jgi:outer membrane protein assembly complex protein YaeT
VIAMLVLTSQHAEAQLQDRPPTERSSGRLEVVAIDIEGARAVGESDLRALLQTRQTSRLPWRERAYFDPAVFEADLRRIETFYRERGYPHARAEGMVDQRANNETRLRIVLHEGEPVRAVQVVFSGFEVLSVDRVSAIEGAAALQPGEPVAKADVEETVRGAITALWNAGYANARVEALETVIAPERVRIEIRAEPGLQAVFGPIDIAGNVTVQDSIIRRQLAYLPGELFQAAALGESQRRLYQLGLFESVDITSVDRENPSSGVATRVTVVERDHTQFTYSFGYGSEEHAYGEGVWRHLNFLGGGRTISTRGKWSWLDRGGEGAFVQPYLFRSGLTLTVSAYVWHFDETPYESLSRGGRAGVNYEVARNTLTSTYIHEFQSVQVPTDAQGDPRSAAQFTLLGLDVNSGKQKGLLSALQFSAERDAAVESAGTMRGYVVAARLEHAGAWLPGSFNYISVSGDGRYYRAIGRVTLAGRIQYGSIAPHGPRSDVPFSKRYFLGGSDSLRGWGRLEVSPLSAGGLPIGGQSLLATTGEMRLPLIGPLGAVVFADAGQVREDAWALSRDLHSDGGLGLHYRSPFALLRFDFAYQLTTVEGLQIGGEQRDRRWRIHFGIGHSF